jgi:glycolate oxidase FAD binding subunit
MNLPASLSAIVDRIRAAAAARQPLALRGGGSKAFCGDAPQGEPLDLRGHAGIVAYEPSELVVTARGGTPLAELEAALGAQGQCLPFEPPHFGAAEGRAATVGGMVAAGLCGPARASVGAVRDYVLGVHLVNGRGQVLEFGGQVMKNVAGYDVSRLMAGSQGTLAALAQVSLKVMPVAPAEATLTLDIDQAGALGLLAHWSARPLPLNASCWHDGRLHLRLRGARAAVQSAIATLAHERGTRVEEGFDWTGLRDQRHPFFAPPSSPQACLWRLSLPQTAPALAPDVPTLVEWQGGLRWLWADEDQADALREAARGVGGSASIFVAGRGGLLGTTSRFHPQSTAEMTIQRRLKAEFDPSGIFNPGRMGF